ncbi:hypothetical protein RE2895_40960 [Rhodococcus erythropolis]|nr:hypothetical protein RE2895_40960 [Rhodococcus erythropolis]
MTDIGEAVLASPSPISVTHHGYVPWVRETVEMTEESSLVDAVQQSAQIHRDITMVSKTTPGSDSHMRAPSRFLFASKTRR